MTTIENPEKFLYSLAGNFSRKIESNFKDEIFKAIVSGLVSKFGVEITIDLLLSNNGCYYGSVDAFVSNKWAEERETEKKKLRNFMQTLSKIED